MGFVELSNCHIVAIWESHRTIGCIFLYVLVVYAYFYTFSQHISDMFSLFSSKQSKFCSHNVISTSRNVKHLYLGDIEEMCFQVML